MPKYWKKIQKISQKWNEDIRMNFVKALSAEPIKKKLDIFSKSNTVDSDQITEEFTRIIQDTLRHFTSYSNYKKRKEDESSPECILAKKLYKQSQRAMKYDISNLNKRQIYIRQKKRYRKIKYRTLKIIKENKINMLSKIESSDPKMFWKKKLKK